MGYRGEATLWHEAVRRDRIAALAGDHVLPLVRLREELTVKFGAMPHVDPFDGGIRARLLVLLETPGPSDVPINQRFVSIDNPTGTAANLRAAIASSGLDRRDMIVWNAVPWIRGRRGAIPADEVRAGLRVLELLLAHLPELEVAVLAGKVAGAGADTLHRRGIAVFATPHPSPTLVNTHPSYRADLVGGFVAAGRSITVSRTADMSAAS